MPSICSDIRGRTRTPCSLHRLFCAVSLSTFFLKEVYEFIIVDLVKYIFLLQAITDAIDSAVFGYL